MNLDLIIIGLIIVIGGILIFKLIKKLVVAALSFMLLIALVVAGIGGLVYYDIQSISQQENMALSVSLMENETRYAGFTLPFKQGEADVENISTYNEDIADEEGSYVVDIEKSSFYEFIENGNINLNNLGFSTIEDFNATITGEEYIEIMESDNSTQLLVDTLIDDYSAPQEVKSQLKNQSVQLIEKTLDERNLTEKDLLLTFGLFSKLDEKKSYVELFKMYKDEEIQIEPQTISMRFISYLPTSFIENSIDDSQIQQE